jgi:hypothetical protein
MRRCRPPSAGCRRRPPDSFGPDEVSWIVRRRPRGHPQTPACEAASCTSRSGTPASSAAEMNAPQRVQRFPVTGLEAPRVPPGPSPGRGRRRPGSRPARSDEISHFAVAGGTRDPVQCAGGRETLRSARSALSVSGGTSTGSRLPSLAVTLGTVRLVRDGWGQPHGVVRTAGGRWLGRSPGRGSHRRAWRLSAGERAGVYRDAGAVDRRSARAGSRTRSRRWLPLAGESVTNAVPSSVSAQIPRALLVSRLIPLRYERAQASR